MVAILGGSGCRIGFEERVGDPSQPAGPDAAIETTALSCWPAWLAGNVALATPLKLAELSASTSLSNPSLTSDGLTLYTSGSDGTIYRSQRTQRGARWTTPVPIDMVSALRADGRFSVTADRRIAVFSGDDGGDQNLWYATGDGDGSFVESSSIFVDGLNTTASELDPELTADGLSLYFAPYDGTNQRIFVSTRSTVSSPFPSPIKLAELQVSVAVGDPVPSPDQRVIVFSSGATGPENDLYYATRADRDGTFGTPRLIAGVNLPGINEVDVEVSSDGCELLFVSDRSGTRALYAATVP